ncbi:hypothetical protein SM124_23640 [Bacillus sp. 31A1R]|uniref:YojE n=1 Tax=Robertmurraya mangrovi TaxID=3098077 RepID=A0ABU5J5J4_9BACI|nr:hypothetical protein [Bacillus sp. 31A1R]MDZ5474638.1 hypothetical protein [Bacillus sp. 31A1R]
MYDFQHLLNQYRALWNNRSLETDNSEGTLREAIKRELKDENSHPRIRRPLYEKFYFAVKRINDSSILLEDKHSLINLHIEILEEIKKES